MRTRFPPSPTGMLHVGSLRTALYCWLLARQKRGTFILRIEDTDQEREVEGAVANIVQTLHWAGLEPDEGVMLKNGVIVEEGPYGPYIQSQRLDIYRKHAQMLITSGHAYYAFDTPEEIDRMRAEEQQAGKSAPKYDLFTRMRMKNSLTLSEGDVKERLAAGNPYVIRLKVPEGQVLSCEDQVRGTVSVQSREVDDTVLLKSDGFPTYHLANVVDDHLMKVELVLRGEEWLPSLPKHLLLYDAFGWVKPQFAHVPLLLNKDRTKLSKRQNDVAVEDYIHKGYLKEALLNFVALLGWNPGTTQEIFTMEELMEQFSVDRIQKGGAVFDLEKLDWLQGQWMRKLSIDEFTAHIQPSVEEKYPAAGDDAHFAQKAALIQDRITFVREAPKMMCFFYEEPKVTLELLASEKQKVRKEDLPKIFETLERLLTSIDEQNWHREKILERAKEEVEKGTWKLGQLLWPLRVALTGLPYSPGAVEVAEVLGKDKTIERLLAVKKQW